MSARAVDRLLLLLLWAGLSAAVLWEAAPLLADHFLGIEYVDHHGTQWFYWFAEKTLTEDTSPLHTDLFFYPWGKDILQHTGANMLDAWAAVPFRMLLGPVLGYNVFVMVGLVLSGLAMGRAAREVTDDRLAIGAVSLLGTFAPYVLMETVEGRPTQSLLLLPALYVAALLRTGRQRGLTAPLLAGLLLALCGYQYWYYAFFGGMIALAQGLWLTLRPGPDGGGRAAVLARHALIAVVAAAVVAPIVVPLAEQMGEVPGLLQVQQWGLYGAEPTVNDDMRIGLLLWEPLKSATGFFVQDDGGDPVFLHRCNWTPAVLLPVVLLGFIKPGRLQRTPWLLMLLTASLLAVGPVLLAGATGIPNLAYIGLVKLVSPMQRLWWPGRAYAFVLLLALVAVAAGLTWLRGGWLRGRAGAWIQRAAVVALVVGQGWHLHTEKLLPYPTWDATVPAGYRCLAEGPPGAILELPYSWTQAHLYYQTVHGRPLLGGMIENNPVFTPAELTALREENSFVARLIAVASGGIEADAEDVRDQDRQDFVDLGYRYVVLQEDALVMKSEARSMLDNALRTRSRKLRRELGDLLGRPVYDDARISIYDLQGHDSPCAAHPVDPDTRPVGRNVTAASDLVAWDPRTVGVDWILKRPDDQAAEETTGDATTTPSEASEDPRRLLWGAPQSDEEAP